MSDAPDVIFLQWHGDGDPDELGEVYEEEVTWAAERIFDHDIEYVRRDGVCVWRYEYDQIDDAETGGCYRPTSHEGGVSSMDWAWCPYCGKRIKVWGL